MVKFDILLIANVNDRAKCICKNPYQAPRYLRCRILDTYNAFSQLIFIQVETRKKLWEEDSICHIHGPILLCLDGCRIYSLILCLNGFILFQLNINSCFLLWFKFCFLSLAWQSDASFGVFHHAFFSLRRLIFSIYTFSNFICALQSRLWVVKETRTSAWLNDLGSLRK